MPSLGIDIGGANVKVAGDGVGKIIYFPMWKKAEKLETLLRSFLEFGERAGIVMTAELSDAFKTKKEGVRIITGLCRRVFDETLFLTVDGELVPGDEVGKINPLKLAASNWVASVTFLLKEGFEYFLFVDMGSTTVDIIPVTKNIVAGRTDFERLRRGELLYFGKLRTPVFYLVREFEGVKLCPEFFAITADALRITGDLDENEYTCDTPDGKGKSVEDCMRRMVRTICCDFEEIGEEKIRKLAELVRSSMITQIGEEIKKKTEKFGLKRLIACGVGEDLVEIAARKFTTLEILKLSEMYGDYSHLFPAYAMYRLVDSI